MSGDFPIGNRGFGTLNDRGRNRVPVWGPPIRTTAVVHEIDAEVFGKRFKAWFEVMFGTSFKTPFDVPFKASFEEMVMAS